MKKIMIYIAAVLTLTACRQKTDYDATGIFEANTVTVAAETAGRIITLNLSEGDSVTAGETLAVIDTTMLVLERRQAGSQSKSARTSAPDISTQATALRSQIAHQEHECERVRRLLDDGAATRKQYEDAQASVRILQGQLQALLSSLGNSRGSISENAVALDYRREQIQEQIVRSVVRSPISGTILQKYAEQGEYATPGKPLFKLANLKDIYLRGYITSAQLADVKLGQKVTVIADFGDGKKFEYPGRVTWIAEESEFTPKSIQTEDSRGNLVYAIKVAVRNDGRLKLGQYGEIRL